MDINLDDAVIFITRNAERRKRHIDHNTLKSSIQCVQDVAKETGLSSNMIEELAKSVVFSGGYDIVIRRKLLHALVPEGDDFPYDIIPLAIASATNMPEYPTWMSGVLTWFLGLLEYGIIDMYNDLVHMCYSPIFNLMSHITVNSIVCRILYFLTKREDITPSRATVLMKLRQKAGMQNAVCHVLRIFHIYRPDLVIAMQPTKQIRASYPKVLHGALLEARVRIQSKTEMSTKTQGLWVEAPRAEKINGFKHQTAIPQPAIHLYPEKLEEQKEKKVFVSQYRRFRELLNGMFDSEWWKWPNNPAAHLSQPIVIPLFRPHEPHVRVNLTNWLEIALQIEVKERRGNPSAERRTNLLQAAHNLSKVTDSSIPVVDHFLYEFLRDWDDNEHFVEIFNLIERVHHGSPEFISDSLLTTVARILNNCSVIRWCKIIASLTNTVCHWAHMAHNQKSTEGISDWPQEVLIADSPVVTIMFVTMRLENFFLAGLIDFQCDPLVVHHILDYYVKVNMHAEVLELPLFFSPPVPIILAVLTLGDPACAHRLGGLLVRMKQNVARLRAMQTVDHETLIKDECLKKVSSINLSIAFFFNCLYNYKAFTESWKATLEPFYPFHSFENIAKTKSGRSYAAATHALPFLPLYTEDLVGAESIHWSDERREVVRGNIFRRLRKYGLDGIERCVRTYSV